MELKHRFIWLHVADGEVRAEPGPKIERPIRFAADPQLLRSEWWEPIELLSQAFISNRNRTGDVLERLDRAVSVTARPGLPARSMQIIDVDDVSGGFRAVCSKGELATISRLNLIIDAHYFATGGEHAPVMRARRVLQLLGAFTHWLTNAPDPLPNQQPARAKLPAGTLVAARVDDPLAALGAGPVVRH